MPDLGQADQGVRHSRYRPGPVQRGPGLPDRGGLRAAGRDTVIVVRRHARHVVAAVGRVHPGRDLPGPERYRRGAWGPRTCCTSRPAGWTYPARSFTASHKPGPLQRIKLCRAGARPVGRTPAWPRSAQRWRTASPPTTARPETVTDRDLARRVHRLPTRPGRPDRYPPPAGRR